MRRLERVLAVEEGHYEEVAHRFDRGFGPGRGSALRRAPDARQLSGQIPHLSKEIEKGFTGLKNLYKRFLEEGKQSGELDGSVSTDAITEIIFNSMLGAAVVFSANTSSAGLDKSVNSLIDYLECLKQTPQL